METVSEYFMEIWSRPLEDTAETEGGSMFHLDPGIIAQEGEDMQEYMLDEKNIAEVIKSRQDLSASGVDGISYRIMKGAGTEGVKFIQNIVRGCLRSGRVLSSWKEARTILIHKKRDRDEIENVDQSQSQIAHTESSYVRWPE
jgi:hypothetical protein